MSLGIEKGLALKTMAKTSQYQLLKMAKEEELKFEMGLIAVGMTGTIDGIGLENVGVKTDRGFIASK